MSRLLPASTNGRYCGPKPAAWALTALSVGIIGPACIHLFLPDGGANVIAGLGIDLASEDGRRVVSLFAWAGGTQLAWGIVLLTISLRYRNFIPAAFTLLLFERSIQAWTLWGPKSGDHHPPEAYGTLAILPVLALLVFYSQRRH
ncbi:MAG: hypothetical protein QNI84_02980 [Henriciella sp.]|nr:hypothetical protein [Henriciella sp.]